MRLRKNRMLLPLALLALTSLTACKTALDLTLFASDLVAVADSATPMDATATLSIETGTKDKCDELHDAVATALLKGFSAAEFVACRTDGTGHFADFRVAVPIIGPKAALQSAVQIVVTRIGDTVGAVLRQDAARIDLIKTALPKEMQIYADQKLDPVVSVTLQNDLADTAKVAMQGAFIDGAAYQLSKDFAVKRRGEIRIVLSDVGNAALVAPDNASLLLFLTAP